MTAVSAPSQVSNAAGAPPPAAQIDVVLVSRDERVRFDGALDASALPGFQPVADKLSKAYVAGFVPMMLERAGVPVKKSLAFFPNIDGAPYFSGALLQVGAGELAIFLPLRNSGSPRRVLTRGVVTPEEAAAALRTIDGKLTPDVVAYFTEDAVVARMRAADEGRDRFQR